jgi:hypothetical protein
MEHEITSNNIVIDDHGRDTRRREEKWREAEEEEKSHGLR